MTPLLCKHCGQEARLTPTRQKELRRAREFACFATVLGLASLITGGFSIRGWPWILAGMSVYVLSQAALKWHLARWLLCSSGKHSYTHYGRIPVKANRAL